MKDFEALREIQVDDYTTPSPTTVGPETSLTKVRVLMESEGIRHLPVVEGKRPLGIISDRDMRLVQMLKGSDELMARDIMTHGPFVATPETPLLDVAFEMSSRKVGSAVIVDDKGEVTGIFTNTDALNALIEILRGEV